MITVLQREVQQNGSVVLSEKAGALTDVLNPTTVVTDVPSLLSRAAIFFVLGVLVAK